VLLRRSRRVVITIIIATTITATHKLSLIGVAQGKAPELSHPEFRGFAVYLSS
jgi:hypothetical protein